LKDYRILVDGKPHIVRILRIVKGISFLFEVDDETFEVDLTREFKNDKPISMKVGGKPVKVEFSEVNEKVPFSIKINGKSFKIQHEIAERAAPKVVEPALPIPVKEGSREIVVEEGVVTAPMPGIVVALKVNVGDSVKAGDGLCILEAMKMENEITAKKAGVVREIRVSEGTSVKRGQPIAIIK
jgi:biotin carboxyl carrier protein